MEINQIISPLIERQFPAIYRDDSPLLVAFLKCYYEWAEQDDNFIKLSRSLFKLRDIDTTLVEYAEYFRSKYLNQLPDIFTDQLMANMIAQGGRFMIKHVLDLYRAKGTERGYKILFRALYNNDVEFYYPGRNLLRASDGVWEVPQYVEITYMGDLRDFEGRVVQIVDDGAQYALCDRAFRLSIGKVEVTVLFLKNIFGSFNYGNLIHPLNEPTKLARIVGSLSSIQVTAGGGNFTVGDIVNIQSDAGVEGLAVVRSTINANGGVTFKIINGGYGYTLNSSVLVTGGNGVGASFKVGSIANTQSIQIINDQLLNFVGTGLAAFGLPGPGTVTVANGQSNVTGVGTTFTTTFANADLIYVIGDGTYKQIINITNNTLLTVNANYSTSVSGATYIDINAPMTTGNVSFTTGSPIITGNGTTFTSDYSVGDFFKTGNQVGLITAIANNTQLTISENISTTNTGVAYFKDYAEYNFPSSIVLKEYVGTRLKDALDIDTAVIGRIDSLTKINPGSGYVSNPDVSVIEPGIIAMGINDGNGNIWGNNAVIEATAGNVNGIITSVQVIDSGFGYKQGESVSLFSNANPAFISFGISNVGRVGKKQGYWKNTNGFLNSKYLIDSWYFQEFSYELQTEKDISVWGDIVTGAIHQAGTKMFGKVMLVGENPSEPDVVDTDIEIVPTSNTLPEPTFAYTAITDAVPSEISLTRSSSATYTNYRGYLTGAANNIIRPAYNAALIYNEIPNPWGDGAVIGGSFPNSGWSGVADGLTATISDVGISPDGLTYTEYHITGISNGNPQVIGTTAGLPLWVPALPSDTAWCMDIGMQVMESEGVTLHSWLSSLNSSGTIINSNAWEGAARTSVDGYLRERETNRLLTNASTAGVLVGVRINILGGNGTVVNARVRITFPVLNRGATQLTNSVPLATLAQRINGIPQYGLLGSVVEGITSTNYAAWGRMEGGVAGTPGTIATAAGFTTSTGSGLTRTLSFGVEQGIPFTQYQYQGTTNATNVQLLIGILSFPPPAAVAGELWTVSAHMRLVAGTLPPGSVIRVLENNASVYTATDVNVNSMNSAPLMSQRFSASRVFTNANTNGATGFALVSVVAANNTPVDITIRVGAPMIEKNNMSSVILPPVSSPVATARAADVMTLAANTIDVNQSTLAMDFRIERGGNNIVSGVTDQFVIDARAGNGALRLLTPFNQTFPIVRATRNSANQTASTSAVGSGTMQSAAISWGVNNTRVSWSGNTVAGTNISPAITSTPSPITIGSRWTGTESGNMIFKRLRLWKGTKLTDAQLVATNST